MTTPLADRIKAIIRANGPMSISDYFTLCLADPEHGYYQAHEPFGRSGDFITAPEISQLFGEMIGVFLVDAWQQHDRPGNVCLVELGPGRGTMMADILRVITRLAPELYDRASIHLVETSKRLKTLQAEALAVHSAKLHWHDGLNDIPTGFLLAVANEFFDALPIRQFVKTQQGFRERMVGLDESGELAFSAGYAGIEPSLLPQGHHEAALGAIAEIAPSRSAVMQMLAETLAAGGGTALIIDYGYFEPGFGDTLQAVRSHAYDPVLAHPGQADLTSHVDFSALSGMATAAGLHLNGMMTQGDFLLSLGIVERAGALGASKSPARQNEIRHAVERLAGTKTGGMGELFKAMAISSSKVSLAPF